jgi:hypothetical protein
VATQGGAIQDDVLFNDAAKQEPQFISGSLMFTKEGTLKPSFSLCYFSDDPTSISEPPKYFSSGTANPIEAMIYGFVIYDKSSPNKRMMVEVTGVGQVRPTYAVHKAQTATRWGDNFNNQSPTG